MSRSKQLDEARAGIEDEGTRLDQFLAECPGIRSRNVAQQLIREDKVSVNGERKGKSYLLTVGDFIEYVAPEETPLTVDPEDLPIDITYEDDDLIVVNKAAGMVVHPGAGNRDGTLVNALLSHTTLASPGAPLRPGIVHRLDKGTSGLLVAAKTDDAYFYLVEQIKLRRVERRYLALVEGGFSDSEGRIEASIRRHSKNRKMMTVGGHGAKDAVTGFQVISTVEGISLLEVKLETGRTHQIRVHMKFIRHPIVGDHVYGNAISGEKLGLNRPWLHAARLSFCHPRDGRELAFTAALPRDLTAALEKAGIVLPSDS